MEKVFGGMLAKRKLFADKSTNLKASLGTFKARRTLTSWKSCNFELLLSTEKSVRTKNISNTFDVKFFACCLSTRATVSPCQLVKISSHFKFSIIQWRTFPLAFSSSFLFSFLNIYELEGGLGEAKRECRFNAAEYFMRKILIRKPVIIIFVL